MEVDPLFIGPAALAKAYRFVGDPRDAQQAERLKDLAEDPARHLRLHALLQVHRGVPQGRRPDEPDHAPAPPRRRRPPHQRPQQRRAPRGARSSTLVKNNGLLWEAELLPRSYGGDSFFGKFAPPAALELIDSLPVITKALLRRKVTPAGALQAAQDPQGRPQAGAAHLRRGRGPRRAHRAQPLHLRHATRTVEEDARHEGRLLARLRQPRLHPRAARLDGEDRPAARHRARRARPRVLLAAPASSPSTTRSWPTRSTPAPSRSPSTSTAPS